MKSGWHPASTDAARVAIITVQTAGSWRDPQYDLTLGAALPHPCMRAANEVAFTGAGGGHDIRPERFGNLHRDVT
uniref:Uncharacterized protein n=1 Tax=Tanacetum cinerariifolium TaxID=118510 RepID=A0A699SYQ1_TANCI|nr:hypothetical protein [Tanacetum cinerariifolium]